MDDKLDIEVTPLSERVTVVAARGILDANTTPRFLQVCNRVKNEGSGLILDLGGVSFIASCGIGGLLALVEEFEPPAAVRFANLSPAVRSVVSLLNLEGFLEIDETVEAAAARLAA